MNVAKDTQKREGISVTLRLGLATLFATLLAFTLFMLLSGKLVSLSPYLLLFGIVPALAYGVGIFLNVLLQNFACGKIDIVQIALSNLFNFAIPAATLALAFYVSFLRSPIESILPESIDYQVKTQFALSFWLFWAALYSQVFTSGFLSIC